MPAGGSRRGRRDNGLVAAEYAVVGDVDPRIGEHLLDVLGSSGIAAYLQPASDLHPVTRTTTLPSRPTDRLFADREHLGTAREYLDLLVEEQRQDEARTSGADFGEYPSTGRPGRSSVDPTAEEIDAVFANIIAAYDIPTDPAARSWPLAEELPTAERHPERRRTDRPSRPSGESEPPTGPQPAHPQGHAQGPDKGAHPPDGPLESSSQSERPSPSLDEPSLIDRPSPLNEPSLLDGLDTFGAGLSDEEEGYQPPPPPPLPRLASTTIAAIVAIVAGLALFIWPALLPLRQTVAMFLGFSLVCGGFAALVLRMRSGEDEEDDDPDDGAKV